MDYRISRLKQEKDTQATRGLNICKERDYTKDIVAWPEGETTINLEIKSDVNYLLEKRDSLVHRALELRNLVGSGANYGPIYRYLDNWTDYALSSGIVSQLGKKIEPNTIPENIVRICWFANITDEDGPYHLDTIRSRWGEFAVGSLLSKNSIKFGDIEIELEENSFSDEFRDLHLTYVDIDTEKNIATAYFADDRSINDPWYGYIHPAFGGKPSDLTKIDSRQRYKSLFESYDMKKIRKEKLLDIQYIESKYKIKLNHSLYFEYLKDLGKFIDIKG